MSPAIEELRRLTRLGFSADPIFNTDGQLTLMIYVRDLAGLRDVVVVSPNHTAHAYRTHNLFNPREPFRIAPQPIQWHHTGDVVTVVHAMLSLPHSAAQTAVRPPKPDNNRHPNHEQHTTTQPSCQTRATAGHAAAHRQTPTNRTGAIDHTDSSRSTGLVPVSQTHKPPTKPAGPAEKLRAPPTPPSTGIPTVAARGHQL